MGLGLGLGLGSGPMLGGVGDLDGELSVDGLHGPDDGAECDEGAEDDGGGGGGVAQGQQQHQGRQQAGLRHDLVLLRAVDVATEEDATKHDSRLGQRWGRGVGWECSRGDCWGLREGLGRVWAWGRVWM